MLIKVSLDVEFPRISEFAVGDNAWVEIDIGSSKNISQVIRKVLNEMGIPAGYTECSLMVMNNDTGDYEQVEKIAELNQEDVYEIWFANEGNSSDDEE